MSTKEKEVFDKNYSALCDIFKTEDSLFSKFVEKGIISTDQVVTISDASISKKGREFLINISGPLEAGQTTGFYIMLEIMKTHGRLGTSQLAKKIEQQLQDCTDGLAGGRQNDDSGNATGVRKDSDVFKDAYRVNQDPIHSDKYLKEKYLKAKTAEKGELSDNLSPEQHQICCDVQVMIINVNEAEFMATMSYLEPPNEKFNTVLEVHRKITIGHDTETAIFHIGRFGKCPVAVMRVNAGQAKAAINQTDFFPNIVLVAAVGVAAGFPENGVQIGDVLVSELITDCASYKHQDDTYILRGPTFPACAHMMQRLKNDLRWKFQCSTAADDNESKVKCGLFLSRPVLLDDPNEREKIRKHFGKEAKGYEMEGYELFGKIDCIIIKGVCDLAGGKTKKWQSTVALAANDLLFYHFNKSDLTLLQEKDKPKDCKQDVQQPPILVQPKENAKTEDDGQKQPVLVPAKGAESDAEDQREECDSGGLKQNDYVKLEANKHNDMIVELADRLHKDGVNFRKLYRYFDLSDEEKAKVEGNRSESERMYETIAQYIERENVMVGGLLKILNKCNCDQSHITFVTDYKY